MKNVSGTPFAFVEIKTNAGDALTYNNINFGTPNDYVFYSNTGAERIRIQGTGNVGIGTSSPKSALHIAHDNILSFDVANHGQLTRNLYYSGGGWKYIGNGFGQLITFNTTSGAINLQVAASGLTDNAATLNTVLTIAQTLNVGIGTTAPGQKLEVYNGTTTGTYTTTGWLHSSDARLKTNVQPIESALKKVMSLEGVYFNWKNEEESKRQMGFIAQDVEKIIPEVVLKDAEGKYAMAYGNLTSILVNAIKELNAKNEEQQKINEQLLQKIERLENQRK